MLGIIAHVQWLHPVKVLQSVYEKKILSLVFLLIINLTSWLRLHQFLGTKTTEANKSLKTDTNGAN